MTTNQKTCLCCGTPLTPLRARSDALCERAECAWKYSTVPDAQRCMICRRALKVAEFAQRTCSDESCRRAWLVERPLAAKRLQQQRLFEEATAWRDQQASAEFLQADAFPLTLVPHNYAVPYTLPDERRERLREHLLRVVREAVDYPDGVPQNNGATERTTSPLFDTPPLADPPSPQLGAVLLQACIGCRGYCCRTGGEHAYITPQTIRRHLSTIGSMTVEQIVASYMSYLVPRTMESGCVYQHEHGCVLPSAMRSDTCNRYYCEWLREYRAKHEGDEAPQAFFVPAGDGNFESGVFVSPGFVKIVRKSVMH